MWKEIEKQILARLSDKDIGKIKEFAKVKNMGYSNMRKKYVVWAKYPALASQKYSIQDFIESFTSENYNLCKSVQSIDYYKIRYHMLNDYSQIHNIVLHTMRANKSSPYSIENVSRRYNISIEEAIEKVRILKSKTSGTLENFILRHGKIDGPQKYKAFCDKSKCTIENYKKRYGEEWETKWEFYIKTRDSSSLNYWTNKLGEEEGLVKFNQLRNQFGKSGKKSYWIDKLGIKDGTIKYDEINFKKANTVKDLAIKNNWNEKEAKLHLAKKSSLYRNLKNQNPDITVDQYLNIRKDNKKTNIKVNNAKSYNLNLKIKRSPVSKSANKFFQKLKEHLDIDIIFGTKIVELKLIDPVKGKSYYYDCFNEEHKIIIEYHGSAFHANPNLTKEERLYWSNPWGKNWKDVRKYDLRKVRVAKNNGYKIYVVWDYECKNLKITQHTCAKLKEWIDENKKY